MNTNLLQIGDWIAVKRNEEFIICRVKEITSTKIGVIFNYDEPYKGYDGYKTGKITYIRNNDIHPIILTSGMKEDLGINSNIPNISDICKYVHELQHFIKIQHYTQKVEGKKSPLMDIQIGGGNYQDLLIRYGKKIIEL